MVRDVDAQTRASSSAMIAWVTMSAPAPPYSTGTPSAGSSSSTQASNEARGKAPSRSTWAAWGAIRASAKCRRVSRNSRWVSLRAKVAASMATSYPLVAPTPTAGAGARGPRPRNESTSGGITCVNSQH